jgi:uridine kinase
VGDRLAEGYSSMARNLSRRGALCSSGTLPPIAASYWVTIAKPTLREGAPATVCGEMHTLAKTMDALVSGDIAAAGDLLMARFCAVEAYFSPRRILTEHVKLIPPQAVRSVPSDSQRAALQSEVHEVRAPVRRVFLVGIAGPSGVGKSTLADQLALKLLSPIRPVCLDCFMRRKRMPKYPSGVINWETPGGIDFAALRLALQDLIKVLTTQRNLPQELLLGSTKLDLMRQNPVGGTTPDDLVIVVEGFLLFHEQSVCSMLDAHMWLEADCKTCSLRRYKRSKRQRQKYSSDAFEKVYRSAIWPQFELFREAQLTNAPAALRLDAALALPVLVDHAAFYCKEVLRGK